MMAYSATRSIIDDLETEVETWRQRAESAEAALYGGKWDVARPPLGLQVTRVMRLLARRPMNSGQIYQCLEPFYPNLYPNTIKVCLSKARKVLPKAIAPKKHHTQFAEYTVPDLPALREFLGETA